MSFKKKYVFNYMGNLFTRNEKNLNTKEYYSIFLSPDDKNMDEQLLDFNNYFDFIDSINKYISQHKIMIRFYPRSSKKINKYCKKNMVMK